MYSESWILGKSQVMIGEVVVYQETYHSVEPLPNSYYACKIHQSSVPSYVLLNYSSE